MVDDHEARVKLVEQRPDLLDLAGTEQGGGPWIVDRNDLLNGPFAERA